MAVYLELLPGRSTTGGGGNGNGRRRRAGIPNVRRPLRGIEVKSNTHAYMRVQTGGGDAVPLTDSSSRTGQSDAYANFLLQSVQETRMERQQILETFGAPYVFFFGEAPRFVDVMAVLPDTQDFNWHAEWWENYAKTFRATRLAEKGSTALLHYDDVILEGYPIQATTSRSSGNHHVVQLQFRMFVTNYVNVSDVGSPDFPIREEAILPEQQGTQQSFTFQVDTQESARRVVFEQLKRTSIAAIRQQIRNARSIERVRELSRLHALKSLGVDTDGANLLTIGKALFQGVVANIRGDGEQPYKSGDVIANELKDALQFTKNDQVDKALETLGLKKKPEDLDALTVAAGASRKSLIQLLQNATRYTAASPVADLTAFLDRIQREVYPNATTQLVEARRNGPIRSKYADNIDEYTQRGQDEDALDAYYKDRLGVSLQEYIRRRIEMLPAAVTDTLQSSGAKPTPSSLQKMGLYSWSPTDGWDYKTGEDALRAGRGFPVDDGRYTYSKNWGTTPDAAGSYGGLLGGSAGPGIGGQAQQPQDMFTFGSGLSQGDPYGNPNLPPHAYTGGYGPDGKELYKKEVQYGSKEDGTFLGGGVVVKEVKQMKPDGSGTFTVLVLEGSLK